MKHTRSTVFSKIRLLALLVSIACTAAQADDYSDVSQLVRAGKLPEALTRADQYLATQPKDPQMRFIKGVIQRDSGKTTEAIATFTRLTEDYPELPEPYNNLAVLYAGLSQFDKARSALEMAIRTNPSYATAHENLGDIYAKLASQAYNKALQLDTGNAAVPPKLALIREIFSNGSTKGSRPASTPQQSATPVTSAVKPPAVAIAAAPIVQPSPVQPKPAAPAPLPTPPVVAPPPQQPATTAATKVPAENVPTSTIESASGVQVKEVEAAVSKWAAAWSARDVKTYLATYGKDFDPPGSMGRKAWEEERTQRILGKSSISVKVEKLVVSVNGSHASAKFRQDYKAGGLAVGSHKTLDFAKVGDHWQIVKETVGN
jgi:tetratricopeptide (TPR) repeat protein